MPVLNLNLHCANTCSLNLIPDSTTETNVYFPLCTEWYPYSCRWYKAVWDPSALCIPAPLPACLVFFLVCTEQLVGRLVCTDTRADKHAVRVVSLLWPVPRSSLRLCLSKRWSCADGLRTLAGGHVQEDDLHGRIRKRFLVA